MQDADSECHCRFGRMEKSFDLNNGSSTEGQSAPGAEPSVHASSNGWSEPAATSSEIYAGATEHRFSETRRLLETLLDNSPDLIYFKDRQSRFVHFSKSFSQLFHLENAEPLRGKTDADFFAAEHAEQALLDEQEIMRTGVPVVGKLEKEVHQDGRVTWALTSKLPWRNEDGEIIGIFGISKNVTQLSHPLI